MIIYHNIQDRCIRTNGIADHGKSNLASNDVENIDLSIVFVAIISTL